MDVTSTLRTGVAAIVTTFAIAAGCCASATVSSASTETDPFWYYNLLGFEAIHDSGLTGEGVTIAVIDAAINPEVPTLQGADLRIQDTFCLDANGVPLPGTSDDYEISDHGTNVVSYLIGTGAGYDGETGVKGVAPGATVLYYPFLSGGTGDLPDCTFAVGSPTEGGQDELEFGLAFEAAVAAGVDIISVSVVGGGDDRMLGAMGEAVREGIIVVGGLGNDDGVSIDGAPGILNGTVSVLGAQSNGELNFGVGDEPNTSEYVQVIGPGWEIAWQGSEGDWTVQRTSSGTSIATPIVAGSLALAKQKYPQASGDQLLQSMIHNTGQEGGDAVWDPTYGYGFVVPDTLLAADPTQYPDVNPLLTDLPLGEYGPLGQPSRLPELIDIFPEGVSTTAEPTGETTGGSSDGSASGSLGTIALFGGIGLLVLVLVISVTVVVVTRKKAS